MANHQDGAHLHYSNADDENEFCGLTSNVTFWLIFSFVIGLVLGIIFINTSHRCLAAMRVLRQKWKERRTRKATHMHERTPELTSQEEAEREEEEEIIEPTEFFTNVALSNRHPPGGSDDKQRSSWAFMNGGPNQEEAVRFLTRRVKELEERETVNSRLLLTLQRKQRLLETSSSPLKRGTKRLMEENFFNEMPMTHSLVMLKLCNLEQKMQAMQNSGKISEPEIDGNHRSLIQYTTVPPKNEPRKYIDLRPFFTSSRPSAFTLPYAPLYEDRWNCTE